MILDGPYKQDDPLIEWIRGSEKFCEFVGDRPLIVSRVKHMSVASRSEYFSSIDALMPNERPQSTIVVLDHSLEGPSVNRVLLEPLTEFCQRWNLDPENVIYVSQNRSLKSNIGARAGLELFKPRWLPFDWWFHTSISSYRKLSLKRRKVKLDDRRLFLCTNRKLRSSRLAVLSLLKSSRFNDICYSSCLPVGGQNELAHIVESCRSDFPLAEELLSHSYLSLVESGWQLPSETDQHLRLYANNYAVEPQPEVSATLIDIVNETVFSSKAPVLRFTEKTLRSMILGRPFIHVGLPSVLELARSFGFRTDFGLIAGDYDCVIDPRERMACLFEEFFRIAELYRRRGHDALADELDQEALKHNQSWALEEFRGVLFREADLVVESWR